jgi:orotidine-5'-phosphate decarboxylase
MSESRIIVALDGMSIGEALRVSEQLIGHVWGFKVNDLFFDVGMYAVQELKSFGNVMLDGKFHDIPNTVVNALTKAKEYEPDIVTIHASGGPEMMRQAGVAFGPERLAAVTVLTSLDRDTCMAIYGREPEDQVVRLASLAQTYNIGYVVCSAKELPVLNKAGVNRIKRIVPGIRPLWHQKDDDQKRTAAPAGAIGMGADLLVMGRPILEAECMVTACKRTNDEIEEALQAGG